MPGRRLYSGCGWQSNQGAFVAGQKDMRRKRDETLGNKDDSRRKEGERAFTNLMKKCVDKFPGNGTAAVAKLFVGVWLLLQ